MYGNEYDFQEDLYVLVFCFGYDGYYVFYLDVLICVFEWR